MPRQSRVAHKYFHHPALVVGFVNAGDELTKYNGISRRRAAQDATMPAIQFDAQVRNGTIEIPPGHRAEFNGSVHVIVYQQPEVASVSKIDELLANPLHVGGFRPLTRDEANGRDWMRFSLTRMCGCRHSWQAFVAGDVAK